MARTLKEWAQTFRIDFDEEAFKLYSGNLVYLEANSFVSTNLSRLAELNLLHRDLKAALDAEFVLAVPTDPNTSIRVDAKQVWSAIVPAGDDGQLHGGVIDVATYQQVFELVDVDHVEQVERSLLEVFKFVKAVYEHFFRAQLRSLLRYVKGLISTLLRLAARRRSVASLFIRQSAFFIIHGEHPPRESVVAEFGPIYRAGGCAA